MEQAVTHFGRLDAGQQRLQLLPHPLGQVTAEAMDALMQSMRAPLLLSQAAAPYLRRQQGCIVNLTDLHGTDPMRDHRHTMAKAALEMATRALALELAPKVRVNAVAPGAILWPEQGKDDFAREALLARTPLARIGTVERSPKRSTGWWPKPASSPATPCAWMVGAPSAEILPASGRHHQ